MGLSRPYFATAPRGGPSCPGIIEMGSSRPSGAFQPTGVLMMWGFEQVDRVVPVDQARSNPHHSATKSAMEPVMRLTEARLTRSSKAWMFSVIGP